MTASTLLLVLAFAVFLAAAIVAYGIRRSWWAMLIALGLALVTLAQVVGAGRP